MTRVLLDADHAVVRAGLRQFLETDQSIRHIGEAGSGREPLEQLNEGEWNLLLLDINMPDRNGLDILRHARARHPETRVLMLSGLPERQYAVNVLRAGASGFLPKDSAAEELLKAVRTVLSGHRYVSGTLADLLITDMDADSDQPLHARLSEREFQIFCKLAEGQSVTEIGAALFLSVKTVSTYRTRILEKMGMKSNADMTYYAIKNDLVQ